MDQFDNYLQYKKEVAQATLKIISQFQQEYSERRHKRTSNIDIAFDVLRSAGRPLHVSEIIHLAKQNYDVQFNRDSIVSALIKKVNAGQGVVRTAPNTFALAKEGP